jgi:hypothetical protein
LFGVRRLAEPSRERVAAVERRASYPRERAEGVVANANDRLGAVRGGDALRESGRDAVRLQEARGVPSAS